MDQYWVLESGQAATKCSFEREEGKRLRTTALLDPTMRLSATGWRATAMLKTQRILEARVLRARLFRNILYVHFVHRITR